MIRVHRNKGFTLFELLVATSIFAIVSYMAYSGLMQVMNARTHVETVENRLANLQMTFLHLGRDIRHIANRSVRSEYGDKLAALTGGELADFKLELTRTGHRNPARAQRSLLQRIGYMIEDDKLYRVIWPVLDRVQGTEPRRTLLLEKTESMEIQFMHKSGEWVTTWPPVSDEEAVIGFPTAIAVKLNFKEMGEINRIFILPEA